MIKLLEENERIFKECGPNSSNYEQNELRMEFSVWENAKRKIIIPNNREIYRVISNLKKITNKENRLIKKMKSHIEHFESHVDNPSVDYTAHQFPKDFSDLVYGYRSVSKKHQVKINKINNWLRTEISSMNIECAFLFGSFLYSENYHDIDLLIKTSDNEYSEIRKTALLLKTLTQKCNEDLGEQLHMSVFSQIEINDFNEFRKKIRTIKEVL